MEQEDLAALLARSRAGDIEAFSRIVGHFQGPLSRYLRHIVGDPELAADLTQDTMLELFESLGRVEVRQVRGWLYRAATHNALSALRRRRRFQWLPFDGLHEHATSDPPLEASVIERQQVRAALRSLPEAQATCLLLHEAGGLRCAEIAEQQGISLAAAKQRLARARRAFIAAYEEAGGATPAEVQKDELRIKKNPSSSS
jgi:RNA polymerase sigma-70 factor (ECF subfamily)